MASAKKDKKVEEFEKDGKKYKKSTDRGIVVVHEDNDGLGLKRCEFTMGGMAPSETFVQPPDEIESIVDMVVERLENVNL